MLEKRGLTQTAFAARLGIKQGVVSGWLSDRHAPSSGTLKAICRELTITEDWLFTGVDSPMVAEAPAPYGEIDRQARRALAEFLEFWKDADDEKKRHLLKQMRWLRKAQESETKK